MITNIHFSVFGNVDPPAASNVPLVPRAKFRLQPAIYRFKLLKRAIRGQRISGNDRIVIKALTRYENDRTHSWSFILARSCYSE